MRKKINRNFMLMCALSIVLTAACLVYVFYGIFTDQMKREVKAKARLLETGFNLARDKRLYAGSLGVSGDSLRISVIDADGNVLYDSLRDPDELDNHLKRPEISDAMKNGSGEARRLSESLGEETYYYAVRLENGYVLRVSEITDSVLGIFYRSAAPIAIILIAGFLLCNAIAGKLAERLIEPINEIDPDNGIYNCYDELAPFVRKIQNQKREIVSQLRDIESRANTLSSIMKNMREGLVLIDKRGIIISVNDSAKEIFAIEHEVVGKNMYNISRNPAIIEKTAGALNNKYNAMDYTADGKIYNISFSPVKGGGAIILCFDITEQSERENLRREFTANVSHELKTPLTTIMGLSELMENGMVKQGDEKGFAGKIKNEAGRLLNLIEDIIRLSEMDEKGNASEKVSVNLKNVALEVEKDLAIHARNNGVKLETQLEDAVVMGSEYMLYEIIYNLVDNAIKYNKENGEVLLKVENLGKNSKITVKDTGIGIPNADKDRVFERFYRVDKSRSRQAGGTGLGLSIVKHAVGYHGGVIDLQSEQGKGTVITITI